mmetsp:Transcript_85840/g.151495  ORF Transcript_85840/g.151495 Transcript_85840/m.151495 type:complete len:159 (+) Transcript_85840:79-555(+)
MVGCCEGCFGGVAASAKIGGKLIEAAERKQTAVLLKLLEQNSNSACLNEVNASGYTLLHLAASQDNEKVCNALLDAPGFTAINVQSQSGFTALHAAANEGRSRASKLLCAHSKFTALRAKDIEGSSAEEIAEQRGFRSCVKAITDGIKERERRDAQTG